jgi:hypothetical protein
MVPVKFHRGSLSFGKLPIDYEWANTTNGTKPKLVAHFFLKQAKKNEKFLSALQKISQEVAKDYEIEVGYTGDFELDGHDLFILDIHPWLSESIITSIIKRLGAANDTNGDKGEAHP